MQKIAYTKYQFQGEVLNTMNKVQELLNIYQSQQRDFEYEVSEESALKTALFTLERLVK